MSRIFTSRRFLDEKRYERNFKKVQAARKSAPATPEAKIAALEAELASRNAFITSLTFELSVRDLEISAKSRIIEDFKALNAPG
jgi:hypothetical protein